ncbi:GlsB/YeaQ/YmgE family stress response membrane protein [Sphaerisporangium sp. TRM90804]|uniref:GlsB/YeaQ/YmgE family stress response membrane protein n=1 Tax=Sphaerisporangium sp. TRM90804 TaxID=3031113 RepID=UPI00244726C0|nr:GlsB/YeaQ/YmgE family stress response membrane protein [Sphaerisporangium sp. TRM90804]MDH2428979.1 GlsB/YeaQ/YmgE family stress response membrane protein [Sphaerisporangium sp. TRM90804]
MTVSGIITALIVGLIVGALGRWIVPGKQNIPIWVTMAIGVVAALLGTILARAVGIDTSGFSLLTLLVQIGLAALGVVVVAGTARRRRTPEAQ